MLSHLPGRSSSLLNYVRCTSQPETSRRLHKVLGENREARILLSPERDALQAGRQYIRKVTRIFSVYRYLCISDVLLYHFIFQVPLWAPSVYFKPEVFRVQRSLGNASLLCCISTILKLTGAWEVYMRITEQEDAQY